MRSLKEIHLTFEHFEDMAGRNLEYDGCEFHENGLLKYNKPFGLQMTVSPSQALFECVFDGRTFYSVEKTSKIVTVKAFDDLD